MCENTKGEREIIALLLVYKDSQKLLFRKATENVKMNFVSRN